MLLCLSSPVGKDKFYLQEVDSRAAGSLTRKKIKNQRTAKLIINMFLTGQNISLNKNIFIFILSFLKPVQIKFSDPGIVSLELG